MHKAVLTAAALAALSVSAVAQQSGMSGQTGQQMHPQSDALPDSSQALAGYQISPQQLSPSQVREIQQALEDRGDGSVSVNGEWGPDTEAALKLPKIGEHDFANRSAGFPDAFGTRPRPFELRSRRERNHRSGATR